MLRGNCNCGSVKFEVDERVEQVFVCHCSICRRATGSNGIAVVLADKSRFRWLAGAESIVAWKKPNADWEMCFCRTCGSPVPGENDANRMFIPAGSISEGGEDLHVAHHIWVASKAPWDVIADAGKQHPEGFRA